MKTFLSTYKTIATITNINDSVKYKSGEFYILPMLRVLFHRIPWIVVQFRWIIWGINLDVFKNRRK